MQSYVQVEAVTRGADELRGVVMARDHGLVVAARGQKRMLEHKGARHYWQLGRLTAMRPARGGG